MSLALRIETALGTVYRWGGDEPDARNAPLSLSFTTSMPGGFSTATITLSREIDRDWPDLNLYDDVWIYGEGNESAWEGRVSELPRSDGDEETITVGCVGWSAHLRDNPSFTEVYVDRDVESWTEPTLNQRLACATASRPVNTDVVATTKQRSLALSSIAEKGIRQFSSGMLMYTMPGQCLAAQVQYLGSEDFAGNFVGPELRSGDDDSDLALAAGDTLTLDDTLNSINLATDYKYLAIQVRKDSVTESVADPHFATIKRIAVYSDHDLNLYSQEDTDEPQGVIASDVVEDVVARIAPKLTTQVEETTYVIPHLVFEAATAEDVILKVNAYHLYEWGVYEDRVLFFRAPDPERLCWQARRDDGAILDLEGSTGDEVYNGVIVSYTSLTGDAKTVGPPGTNSDDDDERLYNDDPLNPVNAHGIPLRTFRLETTDVNSLEGATRLGIAWLEEQSRPQRRGSLEVAGTIDHPTAGSLPVWMIRAGDYVRVADHSGDVARRVIETTYNHDEMRATLTLDNTAPKLEAIIERVIAGR